MNALELHSPVAEPMRRFIERRRLSGLDYASQARLLAYFDRFLVQEHVSQARMTRDLIDRYQQSLSPLSPTATPPSSWSASPPID